MDTCFLFTQYLDTNGCFCLKITSNGELSATPAQRSFAEIKKIQAESATFIVETTTRATLIDLELPWLPDRKARVAIPYALEDKLAQSVEELHFAFDKLRYYDKHYLITVIDKQRIKSLMQTLDEHGIEFESVTLDWFALEPQDIIVSDATLLINNDDFKGALSGELALSYIKNHPLNEVIFFQDSKIIPDTSIIKNSLDSYTWIAQKLLKTKPVNLCQGEMLHGNTSDWIKKGYQLAGILCGIWLISILLVNAITLHSLNKQTDTIDKQIEVIYHEFFPDAKQVISPKFRISQLLGTNSADSQTRFWFLLNQFSKVMKDNEIAIEQLRFQNKTLSVTLVSNDFASLENLENKLKQSQLNVKQTQASTRDQHVVATLELM